ncbi:hypothetical protein [Cellulomonas sp. URHE0023]|uniref:hypothetical protein n=1 Tax=Cellulomonas sp. URHE0023 TaxID=1380354 RepID=UPI00048911E4|nr:hypothetical protein [Cellulomonas sp. URHE0023]
MSTFSVPTGDPDALRRVVSGVATLSSAVGDTRSGRLSTLGGQAAGALPTARVAAFAAARSDAAAGTGAVGLSLVTVGGALADWADALEAAQDTIRSESSKHFQAETSWRRARSMGEAELQDQHHDDMLAASRAADHANDALEAARRRVVDALAGQVDLWAPGAATLGPVEAWRRAAVGNAPSGLALDAGDLVDAYKNPDVALTTAVVTKAVKAGVKAYGIYGILKYQRAPSLALKAEQNYLKARGIYQEINSLANPTDPSLATKFSAAEKALGKAIGKDVPAELRRAQWIYKQSRGFVGETTALQRAAAFAPEANAAQIVGNVGRFESAMRPIRAVMPFASKVLGPLGVVSGGYDMYTAATDDTLAAGDRSAHMLGGLATVVGGGLMTAMAFGAMVTPVGAAVVAVAGVVAVGCWAYENREAIADAATKAAGWVGDTAKDVGGAVADGAKKVWKGLFG